MSILHSPQAPGLRLFNMQESPKVETFGPALNQVGRRNYLEVFSSQRITIQTHDLVQALHMTADQVCKQQEMDHQHQVSFCLECGVPSHIILYSLQTWRMEMAHAHLRTLDWVLQQEPYPGSDAQDSLDREEEMTKMRQIEVEQDVDMEVEEEEQMACTPSTKDTRVPASSPKSKDAVTTLGRNHRSVK